MLLSMDQVSQFATIDGLMRLEIKFHDNARHFEAKIIL